MSKVLEGVIVSARVGGREQKFYAIAPRGDVFKKGLISEVIVGTLGAIDMEAKANPQIARTLRQNPAFVKMLHEFVANEARSSAEVIEEAKRQKDGSIFIMDQRAPASNDQALPEDIIGAFEVERGGIGAYKANANHRLFTEHGLFNLGAGLNQAFLKHLETLWNASGK